MRTEKKQQIEQDLLTEIKEFYEKAEILTCVSAISYLLLSMDEEIDPLTSMDNVNMRSLMQLLINLSRLQTTGSTYP